MSGHTPGPWLVRAATAEDERDINTVLDPTRIGLFIATAWGGGDTMNAAIDANASLIAAAPELLAAARLHDAYLSEYYIGPDSDALSIEAAKAWRQTRAAIAKAEGK